VSDKSVVAVQIAGEEYTIRAHATPEYTRECATYVDRAIREILEGGSLIQQHKAAILAALSITDQLFQAREEASALREEVARSALALADDIQQRLAGEDLASSERG
jgi:cell division protein ZapA